MGSERNTGRRSRRKAAADCRQGNHRYGSPKLIGGGMYRQNCAICGTVSIDITRADDVTEPSLFSTRRGDHDR